MKKSIVFGALAVSLATTSSGYGQSVEELLGLTVSSVQAPPTPVGTGHATAEESPFYVRFAVNPVIEGAINTNPSTGSTATYLEDSKIEFDLGVGVSMAFGFRIPETYIFMEVMVGYNWSSVRQFTGSYVSAGAQKGELLSEDGNLYQVPILFTPGLEFELPGGFPFLHGGAIRFGPSFGVTYHDLAVDNITGIGNDIFSFGASKWVFTYGAMLSIDLFLSHNVALNLGYQFAATTGINYGALDEETAPTNPGVDVKTNFTFNNIISVGISIYF